jgi:hypothetical protein
VTPARALLAAEAVVVLAVVLALVLASGCAPAPVVPDWRVCEGAAGEVGP